MKECENIVGKLFIILLSRAGAKSTTCTNASTWRFVPTHNEPYHLDDYGTTVLRAFWNLSDKPRIWRIGHNALDIANMYKERYIEDSVLVGIKSIDAAYFEHENQNLYAFNFLVDSTKNVTEFFDENGKSLQRTFLKSPLRFSNISSRYNLKRRIAYYGNKVRPHRGTDFAAPTGTPIMATASGRVVKSSYTRGNGYYIKIKHNDTYSTQYLHMQKRGRVKQGSYVKQGDVIGKIGMTGNTSGPHVCYRFWKNGKQVDPFKQKLPPGKPIPKNLNSKFTEHLIPLKTSLDNINYN